MHTWSPANSFSCIFAVECIMLGGYCPLSSSLVLKLSPPPSFHVNPSSSSTSKPRFRRKPISDIFRIKEERKYNTSKFQSQDVWKLQHAINTESFQREVAAVLRGERVRPAAQGDRAEGQARRQLAPRAPPLQVRLLLT